MQRHHHRIIAYTLTGAIIAALSVQYINYRYQPATEYAPINYRVPVESAIKNTSEKTVKHSVIPTPSDVPKILLLKVPFTPQAPTANWDELHNEACEEASAIMTERYFAGDSRATLPPQEVEDQLNILTQWENNHFGYHLDIDSQETAQMIKEVYGLQAKIILNFTEDDIKKELSQNHIVLLPSNGKLLGNPNFRSPGPPYHMLVLKGYTATQFITNDPGTRKGQNYPYTFATLYHANGIFDHATHSVDLKKKNIIVVWK